MINILLSNQEYRKTWNFFPMTGGYTTVTDNIVKRNGMWEIQLVFAHYLQPCKLIKRNIARYSCRNKSELNAWYIRRLVATDQRGTLKVNFDDFRLCHS